jgi:hypothetical protein
MSATSLPAVLLVGQPFWVGRLAALLSEHAADLVSVATVTSVTDLPNVVGGDLAIRVGYRPGAATWRGRCFDAAWCVLNAAATRGRRAYYWIGTDVWNACSDSAAGEHTRWFKREADGAVHWAGSSWLAEELQTIGVPAAELLFPAALPAATVVRALPPEFRVSTYIPDGRSVFYGGSQLLAAARALPFVQFDVFGGTGAWVRDEKPANVSFLGWMPDVTPTYLKSSVLLRQVQHDALGGSVREALALGRHVIYTYPIPHTSHVRFGDVDGLIQKLDELVSAHRAGTLRPNLEGMAYARQTFDPRVLTRTLAERLREAAI